ncbi:hypothetical protein CSB20_10435 [bacterium DOLZORAL124_64_63]|nr:MAG: hypothetical protein CSB20_10435 [bacterium DOLZORAL124_64_63]
MSTAGSLITVAVTVHDGRRFLREALGSALAQTHEQLEVLVYDDASNDGSAELAEGLGDPRVRVLRGRRNVGVGAARQILKTEARGDHIVWLDADDVMEPRRLEILLAEARLSGADIVIDTSVLMDEDGRVLSGCRRVPDHVADDPHFTRLFERNRMNPHPLVSRRCFAVIDFDPGLRVSEDYDFWLKASYAGFRFRRVEQALHRYRLTGGSLSSHPRPAREAVKKIFGRYSVEALKDLYRRRGFAEESVRGMACVQHIFRENFTAALAEARRPWARDPAWDPDFYRGTLELQCGDPEEAGRCLRRHLDHTPASPAGWNNLGVYLRRRGQDPDEAWRQARKLFPGYHDVADNLRGRETLTLTQLAAKRHR